MHESFIGQEGPWAWPWSSHRTNTRERWKILQNKGEHRGQIYMSVCSQTYPHGQHNACHLVCMGRLLKGHVVMYAGVIDIRNDPGSYSLLKPCRILLTWGSGQGKASLSMWNASLLCCLKRSICPQEWQWQLLEYDIARILNILARIFHWLVQMEMGKGNI